MRGRSALTAMRESPALATAFVFFLGAGEAASADEGRDLARFTPGSLLARGETEFVLFQNVYTQTRFYDEDGEDRDAGGRATYSTTLVSWTRGFRPRANVGLEAALRSVADDAAVRRAPPAETDSRTALAWVAPHVEFAPWLAHPSLTADAGLRIPLARDLDGADDGDADDRPEAPFLDTSDLTLFGRLRADRSLGPPAYLYLEAGGEMRVDGDGPDGGATPLKAIAHWLATESVTIYVPLETTFFWGGASTGDWSAQAGLGMKFRPRRDLELEALATKFPAGRNAGAGATFNLGLRWVRSAD